MSFMDSVAKFGRKALTAVKADSPAILTAMGVAGLIVTVISVAKESPKAVEAVKDFEEKKGEPASVPEKITVSSKYYWKPVLTGALTVACFVGANHISAIRMAGYQAALASAQNQLDEYKNKTKEVVGEKKAKDIDTAVVQERLNNSQVPDVVMQGKGGNTLCYDYISGRYFYSDYQSIKDAINDVNYMMNSDCGYATLNDVYERLGLDTIPNGDKYVWGFQDGMIKPDLSDSLVAPNHTPALILKWINDPSYDPEYK